VTRGFLSDCYTDRRPWLQPPTASFKVFFRLGRVPSLSRGHPRIFQPPRIPLFGWPCPSWPSPVMTVSSLFWISLIPFPCGGPVSNQTAEDTCPCLAFLPVQVRLVSSSQKWDERFFYSLFRQVCPYAVSARSTVFQQILLPFPGLPLPRPPAPAEEPFPRLSLVARLTRLFP